MGDRIVYTIKQSDGYAINLYSHWGGFDRYKALAFALDKARPRWTDETYCSRIIVSNLIGPDWSEETGFGLWAGNGQGEILAGDYPDIIIDLTDNTVNDETGKHEFDEFINYHGTKLTEIKI